MARDIEKHGSLTLVGQRRHAELIDIEIETDLRDLIYLLCQNKKGCARRTRGGSRKFQQSKFENSPMASEEEKGDKCRRRGLLGPIEEK